MASSNLPPLLPDASRFSSWQSADPTFYLNAAMWTIRRYLGWQVAPSFSETQVRCWFNQVGYRPESSNGLVMLPSTYVTSINKVMIDDVEWQPDSDYFWDANQPWITLRPLVWPKHPYALIDFTHGYDTCPPDLEAVIYEMTARAMELPASNATNFSTMDYSMQLNRAIGISLTDDQKNRISRYKLINFGRPRQ